MSGLKNFREGVIAGFMGFLLAAFASTAALALLGRSYGWEVFFISAFLAWLSAFVCVWWTYFIPEDRPWYERGLMAGTRGGLVMAVVSAVLSVAFSYWYTA